MKLGKIFILVLSLLMLKFIKILVTDNRTIVLDDDIVETEDGYHFIELCHYCNIRRRNLKIVIRKRKWFSRF